MIYILSLHKKDSRKQLEKLLQNLPSKNKVSNAVWNLFFGKVKISEDPVKLQRKLRDEWK